MTETLKLPIDLNDLRDPRHLNERVRTGVAELDWSRVRDAPDSTLVPLLSGLDLSRDADGLGLETIPEELEDAVVQALENGAQTSTRATAQTSSVSSAPEVWEADREPAEGALGEEIATELSDDSGGLEEPLLAHPRSIRSVTSSSNS
jgi:hypothetical protein